MKEVKSWSDVTIGQYQEIMNIDTESEITRFIESLSIILDCDSEIIRSMNIKEYNKLVTKTKFLSEEPKSKIQRKITIDGITYGLIPDMTLMEAGVFIDADQFKEDSISNLHLLTALIYRPVIKEDALGDYEIQKHKAEGFEKRANLFRDKVSIESVMGAVLFFSLVEMRLLEGLITSFWAVEDQKEEI